MYQIEISSKPFRFLCQPVAAAPIEIAADGNQTIEGPECLNAGTKGINTVTGYEDGWPVTVKLSRGNNIRRRNARQSCSDVGWKLIDSLKVRRNVQKLLQKTAKSYYMSPL